MAFVFIMGFHAFPIFAVIAFSNCFRLALLAHINLAKNLLIKLMLALFSINCLEKSKNCMLDQERIDLQANCLLGSRI